MGAYYDEIEIEDMAWDEEKGVFHYPCPCGDRFEISRKQLANCEDIATCPSCSLIIRVIYDPVRSLIQKRQIYNSDNRSLILRMSRPMMRTPVQVSRKKTMGRSHHFLRSLKKFQNSLRMDNLFTVTPDDLSFRTGAGQ